MYHGDTIPGFPQHPHRGFETVTFVREGYIDHSDSLGATARFGRGDVQWLTAGAGIVHSEMFPLLQARRRQPARALSDLGQPAGEDRSSRRRTSRCSGTRTCRAPSPAEGVEVTVVAGALDNANPPAPPPDSWAANPEADLAIWLDHARAGREVDAAAGEGRAHGAHVVFLRRRQARDRGARADEARRDRGRGRSARHSCGAGRQGRGAADAGPADRRARRAVRPVRHEHARRASAGVQRLPAHAVRRLAVPRPTTPCTRASAAASRSTPTGASRTRPRRRGYFFSSSPSASFATRNESTAAGTPA